MWYLRVSKGKRFRVWSEELMPIQLIGFDYRAGKPVFKIEGSDHEETLDYRVIAAL